MESFGFGKYWKWEAIFEGLLFPGITHSVHEVRILAVEVMIQMHKLMPHNEIRRSVEEIKPEIKKQIYETLMSSI